jgi:YesN/AraC family two-component response regulator
MIRVVIADDQPLVLAGLRALFEHAEDIIVVGEAANGRAAVEVAHAERPQVVLMTSGCR